MRQLRISILFNFLRIFFFLIFQWLIDRFISFKGNNIIQLSRILHLKHKKIIICVSSLLGLHHYLLDFFPFENVGTMDLQTQFVPLPNVQCFSLAICSVQVREILR